MKIHVNKALEILQLAIQDPAQVSPEDLKLAMTLSIESLLAHRNRKTKYKDAPFTLLPHEQSNFVQYTSID